MNPRPQTDTSPPPSDRPTVSVDMHQAAVLAWMDEIAPYGILTTDTQLVIRSWNEWLETHSGMAAPLMQGRLLVEAFPELRTRKLEEHFRRALKGEVIVLSSAFHDHLLPFPAAQRDTAHALMQQTARIAPLSHLGQICGTITIIEDVTQRELQAAALTRQHERDHFLSASLAHLLRTRDPENMVRELFPRLAEQLEIDTFFNYLLEPDGQSMRLHASTGITESEAAAIRSLPIDQLFCGLSAANRRTVQAYHLQSSEHPTGARLKDLGLRAASCHLLMVGDRLIGALTFATRNRDAFEPEEVELMSTISQYVAVALDRSISETALNQARQELEGYALDLEEKIQERTARLQDTVVQLESFSYTVAHDLRAPIRALKGYAQVLMEDTVGLSDDARMYLSRMERAANRLDALTRDLLQFSTISRQHVTLNPVNLLELIQDLVLLRPALHEDALSVKEPLHAVLGHRTLLEHCLSNLIDNALKFVTPNVPPRITIWTELVTRHHGNPGRKSSPAFHPAVHPEVFPPLPVDVPGKAAANPQDHRVRLWIEDNGIGIAPESREKIFGIFERLNPQEKYEGTGIGLAIVARAVQRMGGTCGVEPGVGSRFWLELLPASSEPSPA
jgi:signal transduction histidine kinase